MRSTELYLPPAAYCMTELTYSSVLSRDRRMAALVARYGEFDPTSQSPFQAIVRAVVCQQISTKAANTIRGRLAQTVGTLPSDFRQADSDLLRSVGLPGRKAAALLTAATAAHEGLFDSLGTLPDEGALEQLTRLAGVGPWTAEMVLIFGLGRPDVWPTSDAGLCMAVRSTYGADDRATLDAVGTRFKPFRSWAARYLWASLENA